MMMTNIANKKKEGSKTEQWQVNWENVRELIYSEELEEIKEINYNLLI